MVALVGTGVYYASRPNELHEYRHVTKHEMGLAFRINHACDRYGTKYSVYDWKVSPEDQFDSGEVPGTVRVICAAKTWPYEQKYAAVAR